MTDGIINVLKPCGMTSHDVIGFLRRVLNTKKSGIPARLTLMLPGCCLFCRFGNAPFGIRCGGPQKLPRRNYLRCKTDTGDDSGTVTERSNLPACSKEDFSALLAEFTGRQKQLPPMYSALKLNGQPLYKLARKGISVERQEREIFIYRLQLLSFSPQKALLDVECSKGTYIRTLLEDICAKLGVCGTMSFCCVLRQADLK